MHQLLFWKECPDELALQIRKMATAYPDFVLQEYGDGRKYWIGTIKLQCTWTLRVEYDKDYPDWWLAQDLIRVYCEQPGFIEQIKRLGNVPRILFDSDGEPYISTYLELTRSKQYVFSAKDHLDYAIMWLKSFEIWQNAVESADAANPYTDYFLKGKKLRTKKPRSGVLLSQK